MGQKGYELGMIGLGTMGRNMLLNMADHGYSVVGYDRDMNKVEALRKSAEGREICGAENIAEFVDALRKPRAVMLLVPAGAPVDAVIKELTEHLDKGDLIIDGGNSHFTDTDRRFKDLTEQGIDFLGVGVSGGEYGARHGPSIMPGGSREAYERVRPVLEAVAAHVNNEPCVAYMGPRSAGHYVKMVHNGIEYGVMETIAESYDLFSRGLGLNNDELHAIYEDWNQGELEGYLMNITARIFAQADSKADGYLIDHILDVAGQKGTGMWASQDAMRLGVPLTTIDMAVAQRTISDVKEQRRQIAREFASRRSSNGKNAGNNSMNYDRDACIQQIRNAVYASMILTYGQGMALLAEASKERNYELKLADILSIWRGGCIIRAGLLNDLRDIYRDHPDLPNLLFHKEFANKVMNRREDLAHTVMMAARLAIPVPALMASLSYMDSHDSERLPANLIQAQRDFFGSHTYERVDKDGTFHTDWPRGEEGRQ